MTHNPSRRRFRSSSFSGTSTEFLGPKNLPKKLLDCPNLFIFGPAGVGKTMVAKNLLGKDTICIRQRELMDLLTQTLRKRKWSEVLTQSSKLLFELPPLLETRPQVRKMLSQLLTYRTDKGFRTAMLDAEDFGSTHDLMGLTQWNKRSILILRFPNGRGRYRFAAHACREHNIPTHYSKQLGDIANWTYEKMFAELNILEKSLTTKANATA